MYHSGNRQLQAHFGTEALADRLVEKLTRDHFTDADQQMIHGSSFFFLATADAEGRPDCSYKGGAPGFVRVVSPRLMIYPDYDGNGMFKSLGNINANPHVGLLFIAMGDKPARLRVNGRAELSFDDPLLAEFPGGQLLVRVIPERVFPNCPRYIHKLEISEPSKYVPQAGSAPLEPAWKGFADFKDVVPPRKPTA